MEDNNNQQAGQVNPPAGQPGPQSSQGAQSAGGGQPNPPAGGQPQAGAQAQGGQKKSDLSGIMEENVDISSLVANAGNQQQIQEFAAWAKANMPAHPNTQFNDDEFIGLLAGSISLTFNEKKGIISNVPKLSQFQVDELMKIFKEEQQKFTELEKKHAEQMAELEKQYSSPEAEQQKAQAEEAKAKDLDAAEELKRKLMGGGQ